MKQLAIDARFLNPETSGLGRYTFDLLARLLPKISYEVVVFVPNGQQKTLQSYLGPHSRVEVAGEPWYSLAEQTSFRRKLREVKPDLIHFLQFNHPFKLNLPYVVTIHDLVLDDYPTPGSSFVKKKVYRWLMADAVHQAKKIIAVTQATADDLIQHYHADPKRITVIHHAADSLRNPPLPKTKPTELPASLRQLGVQEPFFLSVGQQRIHKNIDGMTRGFAAYRQQYPESSIYRLVIAGRKNKQATWIARALTETGLTDRDVIFTDFVSDADLATLYSLAVAFVFPSLAEGFGLGGLEAMRYGLPVLASDIAVFREVFGEAALYFDPQKPGSLAKSLHTLAIDAKVRQNLSQLGKTQQNRYTWERAAEQTAAVYDQLLG